MSLEKRTGIVIKNYNSYYYVATGKELVPCKIRGRFKKNKFSLLTGDTVVFSKPDFDGEGSIEEVLPRKNRLFKPAVANVDQIMLVFAVKNPDFNQNVLDRFLISVQQAQVPVSICFSKMDLLDSEDELHKVFALYEKIGHKIFKVSAEKQTSILTLKEALKSKTTVFAGLSGAGKSTLLNNLYPGLELATGEVSLKNSKGRHTTRFSQLIATGEGYIVDTPGFSFTDFESFTVNEVEKTFLEFAPYRDECRFSGCLHISEPNCAVKTALKEGLIDEVRYDNYLAIINEIKEYEERKFK